MGIILSSQLSSSLYLLVSVSTATEEVNIIPLLVGTSAGFGMELEGRFVEEVLGIVGKVLDVALASILRFS